MFHVEHFAKEDKMLTKRIIACLDVRAGRVVKGIQFVDIVDAGDPAETGASSRRSWRR